MSEQDGDFYNLRAGIYPDASNDAYTSVFPKRVSHFSTAARLSSQTLSFASACLMRTSPSLSQWLDVVGRSPEYLLNIELPNPPYRAYQWMDEE